METINIKVRNKTVTVFKNSNMFKIGEDKFYLSKIVWDNVTEDIIKEIKAKMPKETKKIKEKISE